MIYSLNSYTDSAFLYGRGGTAVPLLRSQPAQTVRVDSASGAEDRTAQGGDRVELSEQGQELSRRNGGEISSPPGEDGSRPADPGIKSALRADLSQEELQAVEQLKARDREVRAHEAAHLAQAGGHAAGGASFTYQQGPDGNRYAIGGEVPINISAEQTPEATIQKMQTVRRAALAPASPSAADRSIAAAAAQKEAAARMEIQQENVAASPTEGKQDAPAAAGGSDSLPAADPTFSRISIDVTA